MPGRPHPRPARVHVTAAVRSLLTVRMSDLCTYSTTLYCTAVQLYIYGRIYCSRYLLNLVRVPRYLLNLVLILVPWYSRRYDRTAVPRYPGSIQVPGVDLPGYHDTAVYPRSTAVYLVPVHEDYSTSRYTAGSHAHAGHGYGHESTLL